MAKKPRRLPALDERVAEAPPRQELCARFGVYPLTSDQRRDKVRQVSEEVYRLLKNGRATVAWVVQAESEWESGYEAGPRFTVQYAFEDEASNERTDHCGGSFDGMHLAYGGGNEWTDFLQATCQGETKTFTVLHDENASVPVAYLFSC